MYIVGYVSCIHDTCTFSHIYEIHYFLDFEQVPARLQWNQTSSKHLTCKNITKRHKAESSTSGCAIDASGPTSPISLMKKWWFNSLLRHVLWDVFERNAVKQQFWVRPVLTWTSYQTWPKRCRRSLTPKPKCINGSTESRHLLPRRLRPMASAMKAWVNSHKSTHKFEPQGHQSKIPTLQTWSNRANWDLLQSRSVISSLTHEKDKKKPAAWRPGQSLKFHLRACSLQASRLRPPVKLYRKQQANEWQGWWCLVLKVFPVWLIPSNIDAAYPCRCLYPRHIVYEVRVCACECKCSYTSIHSCMARLTTMTCADWY